MADRNRDAAWQVATPGVALLIGGPVFATRFPSNPAYVALGVFAGLVGVAILIYTYLRYFRRRS